MSDSTPGGAGEPVTNAELGDKRPTSLDDARRNIRVELWHLADSLLGDAPLREAALVYNAIGQLARAYRDLGGDLELPPTPLAPAVGRVETGLVDKVAEHAVRFVAELPGLEDALSHADVLHGELEAITAAPTPLAPITGPST